MAMRRRHSATRRRWKRGTLAVSGAVVLLFFLIAGAFAWVHSNPPKSVAVEPMLPTLTVEDGVFEHLDSLLPTDAIRLVESQCVRPTTPTGASTSNESGCDPSRQEEWRRMARLRATGILRFALAAPEQLDATKIARSVDCNPRDICLDAKTIASLHDLIELHRPILRATARLMDQTMATEVNRVVATGQAPELTEDRFTEEDRLKIESWTTHRFIRAKRLHEAGRAPRAETMDEARKHVLRNYLGKPSGLLITFHDGNGAPRSIDPTLLRETNEIRQVDAYYKEFLFHSIITWCLSNMLLTHEEHKLLAVRYGDLSRQRLAAYGIR